jgi:hypothetical protein
MYTVLPEESTSTCPSDVDATWSPVAGVPLPDVVPDAPGDAVVELLPPQALRVRAAVAPTARMARVFMRTSSENVVEGGTAR